MIKKRKIFGVIGMTGRGKSYFVKNWLAKRVENLIVADTMNEYNIGEIFHSFEDYWKALKNDKFFQAAATVKCTKKGDEKKLLALSANISRPHCLLFEEVSLVCSPHTIDENLGEIVRRGRHFGTSLIYTAQRAGDISRLLTSQTDVLISFEQQEPSDIKALKTRSQAAENLKFLKKGEFLAIAVDSDFSKVLTQSSKYTLKNNKIIQVK